MKQMLKVSTFYHEKQKSFISKKKIFWEVVYKYAKMIPKDGGSLTQFSQRFWFVLRKLARIITALQNYN